MTIQFESITYNIGTYALSYLINGDASSLKDEDQYAIDDWVEGATEDWEDSDGNKWTFSHWSPTGDIEEFGVDAISGGWAQTEKVDALFRLMPTYK